MLFLHQLNELFWNALHSTPQGYVGVSLIFIYLVVIVCMGILRIKQGLAHHH